MGKTLLLYSYPIILMDKPNLVYHSHHYVSDTSLIVFRYNRHCHHPNLFLVIALRVLLEI